MKPHIENGFFNDDFVLLVAERPKLVPKLCYDCNDCAELNYNEKHILEFGRNIQLYELVNEYHMTCTADGQPFGNSLDDTENDYLNNFNEFYHLYPPILYF